MTLAELAVDHPYYCADCNYYSNESGGVLETMTEFLDEFEGADIDMNLVFRWDVKPNLSEEDETPLDTYYAEIFMMHQRKGIFAPFFIRSITEDEVPRFVEYLKEHHQTLQQLWQPL
ncbi:hypothetical protein phiST2_0054 [Vibrio phage phi-ST2]|nr:hypothetical protein phiST2_0054 [Vibrio phage phi-ST2]